jgi:hypothetical protein
MKTTIKQSVSLSIPVVYLGDKVWKGSFEKLPANQTYSLIIDYPLDMPANFPIKTGKTGMTIVGLLAKIGEGYRKVYENATRFGIWGHSIDDLCIVEIKVDHKTKRITLGVDS